MTAQNNRRRLLRDRFRYFTKTIKQFRASIMQYRAVNCDLAQLSIRSIATTKRAISLYISKALKIELIQKCKWSQLDVG
jgi:hypothetical protein